MADYNTFDRFSTEIQGCRFIVVGKPGTWSWDRVNPGTAALLGVAFIAPQDRVLDLGSGTGIIGAFAAVKARQARVTLVDCHVVGAACSEQTLSANSIENATVRLDDGVCSLSPGSFDLVLSHLPRGRAVQEEMIRGAALVLRPGGRFCFVAHRRAGIKGAIAFAREVFGQCGVVRQKKGYHVALATKPEDLQLAPLQDGYITRRVVVDKADTTLVSKPGVFAWDRLDDGTSWLVSAMQIQPHDRVLDLGCGTGLAGVAAARRASAGEVFLADADVRAVESARRTLTANELANASARLSDCGSAFLSADMGRYFDVVITNPPFHQGVGVDYDVARQFVRDAARVLRRGGRLYLVANRFLRYEGFIQDAFGNVAVSHTDRRYHVLTAVARGGNGA